MKINIAVAGTGYVGLVAGLAFSEIGHMVTCVNVDEDKISSMKPGICPIYEPELQNLMKKIKVI